MWYGKYDSEEEMVQICLYRGEVKELQGQVALLKLSHSTMGHGSGSCRGSYSGTEF